MSCNRVLRRRRVFRSNPIPRISTGRHGDTLSTKQAVDTERAVKDAVTAFEEWNTAGRPPGDVPRTELTRSQVAALIDHTQLKPEADHNTIRRLCEEASTYGFATVCVHSSWTPTCSAVLADTPVAVCTVTGFPHGTNITSAKCFEAEQAMESGATEIDMVIHIGHLKGGDYAYVVDDIAAVAELCHAHNGILKTIIETCLLSDREKVAACALAKHAGADFVKTSTGFNGPGATLVDVALMRHAVGTDMGVKAAGGIHSYEELVAMVRAGASRIGASAGVQIVQGAKLDDAN